MFCILKLVLKAFGWLVNLNLMVVRTVLNKTRESNSDKIVNIFKATNFVKYQKYLIFDYKK